MVRTRNGLVIGKGPAADAATFQLERFAWEAPDRLEVAGRFNGLPGEPPGDPVLVLSGSAQTYRLPALEDSASVPPPSGNPWRATFVWQQAPAPFDAAHLELGGDVVVELPQPRARRMPFTAHVLRVQGELGTGSETTSPGNSKSSHVGAVERRDGVPGRGAAEFKTEVELLTARERMRELETSVGELKDALSRAQAELAAERERHAVDSERFRRALAEIEARAEQVMQAEHEAAHAEISALRQRTAVLEESAHGAEQLRSELERAGEETEKARSEVEETRSEVEEARSQAEQARSQVEQARSEAEEARSLAEHARSEADEARSEADEARSEAEAARSEAEAARSEAEAARSEAEAARSEAEAARTAEQEANARAERSLRAEHEARTRAETLQVRLDRVHSALASEDGEPPR